MEVTNEQLRKKLKDYENKLISLEIDCYNKKIEIQQLKSEVNNSDINMSNDQKDDQIELDSHKSLIEENEGLRNGLVEILTYIKDNSEYNRFLNST